MDLGLTGKHVLITGGTRGIGLACARLYLEEGARVSICGRSAASGQAAVRELAADDRVDAHVADVTDPAAALRLVDEAEALKGPIDILVNSAGAAARRPFSELDSAAWHAAMESKFHTYVNVIDVV